MADNSDDDDNKTEDPSERKIQNALDEGNVPFSRETVMFASLVTILATLSFFASDVASHLTAILAHPLDHLGSIYFTEGEDATEYLDQRLGGAALAVAPIVLSLMGVGLLASLGQNTPRILFKRIMPDPSRISPKKGWKRIFGLQGLVEFGKSLFKFIAISIVGALALQNIRTDISNSLLMHPGSMPTSVLSIVITITSSLVVAAAVLAAVDFSWSRFHWRRQLRMSHHEVKREHKESEGDPIVKARLRSVARQRGRQRMMAQVPLATLVLANPTHFAVALRYKPESDPAPIVLAKGQDLIALKIREVAEANGVPVVEDKALARSLYAAVEVDQLIPSEFYRAVAEIVVFLYSRSPNHGITRTT